MSPPPDVGGANAPPPAWEATRARAESTPHTPDAGRRARPLLVLPPTGREGRGDTSEGRTRYRARGMCLVQTLLVSPPAWEVTRSALACATPHVGWGWGGTFSPSLCHLARGR